MKERIQPMCGDVSELSSSQVPVVDFNIFAEKAGKEFSLTVNQSSCSLYKTAILIFNALQSKLYPMVGHGEHIGCLCHQQRLLAGHLRRTFLLHLLQSVCDERHGVIQLKMFG